MDPRAAALRELRIIHAVFIVAVLMQVYVSEVAGFSAADIPKSFIPTFAVLACIELIIARYFRAKRINPAIEKLRRDPNDLNALRQWRAGIILALVLVMSVSLYGVALRAIGADRWTAWPFFLVALIFMLIWRPQLDAGIEVPKP